MPSIWTLLSIALAIPLGVLANLATPWVADLVRKTPERRADAKERYERRVKFYAEYPAMLVGHLVIGFTMVIVS